MPKNGCRGRPDSRLTRPSSGNLAYGVYSESGSASSLRGAQEVERYFRTQRAERRQFSRQTLKTLNWISSCDVELQ